MTNPRIDEAIDRCIRFCSPDNAASVDEHDAALRDAESVALEEASPGDLARVRAHRIHLALQASRYSDAVDLSTDFPLEASEGGLERFNVVAARSAALHALGRHDEEIREVHAFAGRSDTQGSEFVLVLENLATRHPGAVGNDVVLGSKLERAVESLRPDGYADLPMPPYEQVEEAIVRIAAEWRRANREMAARILLEDS